MTALTISLVTSVLGALMMWGAVVFALTASAILTDRF